jgi:hypothetical protein
VNADVIRDITNLQEEIQSTNEQMIKGVFLVVFSIIICYIAAEALNKLQLHKLVLILAVTAVFWICREDYIIHRAGAYIQYAQELGELEARAEAVEAGVVRQRTNIVPWEESKQGLKSRYLLLPIDLLAALAIFWILWQSGSALYAAGETRFVWASGCGVILGIALTGIMVVLARIRV